MQDLLPLYDKEAEMLNEHISKLRKKQSEAIQQKIIECCKVVNIIISESEIKDFIKSRITVKHIAIDNNEVWLDYRSDNKLMLFWYSDKITFDIEKGIATIG